MRAAWLDIDLDAVAHNVSTLRALTPPSALCAVVKADGYGHGAVEVATAAVAAGASSLAVALTEEGVALRAAGIDAPILVLSEPPVDAMCDVVEADLTPTLYTFTGIEAAARAAERVAKRVAVHVKVDTGMHRVGAAPEAVVELATRVVASPHLELEGLFTHLAVADEPDDPFTDEQLRRLDAVRASLAAKGIAPDVVHAANSAAAITRPQSRLDLVRCGIAVYGLAPSVSVGNEIGLRPALSLKARVSFVKRVAAGEALSYGLRYRLDRESVIATVPLGYADGVRRTLGEGDVDVLVGGRRAPIAGTVTMDQILVDCGPSSTVAPGDEVVLLGHQGAESITADDWARRLGTINYEIVCGFGARLPRVYHPA